MIFEDSTMWKYRDLTELTQNKYFIEFVNKYYLIWEGNNDCCIWLHNRRLYIL